MSCAAGTTRLISPSCNALDASIESPVSASSRAMAMGSRLGSRMSPPAPATSPRLASGMPKVAWSAATTRSHESMISHPPARAAPFTAAMIGLGNSSLGDAGEASRAAHDGPPLRPTRRP